MMKLSILERQVIQTNPLVEARKYMNLSEMRLFLLGLQDVKPYIKEDTIHDVDFHDTIITPSELKELFGNNDGNVNNLKRHIKKAFDGKIELSDGYGGYVLYHIYQKMHYYPEKGLLIKFDDEMKPYILDILGKAYTTYSIKAVFPLSSEYAWRLLESLLEKQGFLKQGHNKVYCDLTIEEVRFRLNVPENLYKGRLDNFRSRVLDLPIKDINEKTEYNVWYEVIKTGRRVTGFRFWLAQKAQKQLPAASTAKQKSDELDDEQRAYLKHLKEDRGVNPTATVIKYLKTIPLDELREEERAVLGSKDTAMNLAGLIISAFKNRYAKAAKEAKKQVEEAEEAKRQDRRQAYDAFHGTSTASIGRPVTAANGLIVYVPEEDVKEEKSDSLTDLEVDMIKAKGEKAGGWIIKHMERLGLTIDDVMNGKVS